MNNPQARVVALVTAMIGVVSAAAFLAWYGFNSAVGIPLGIFALWDLRSRQATLVRLLAITSIVLGTISLVLVVVAVVNNERTTGTAIAFWLFTAAVSTIGWLALRGVLLLVWQLVAAHRQQRRENIDSSRG